MIKLLMLTACMNMADTTTTIDMVYNSTIIHQMHNTPKTINESTKITFTYNDGVLTSIYLGGVEYIVKLGNDKLTNKVYYTTNYKFSIRNDLSSIQIYANYNSRKTIIFTTVKTNNYAKTINR